MVRFGVEFVPSEPFWKVALYAVEAEKLGFDYVWVTDHYNNRNVFTTLATIAIYTHDIRLGIGVTNPYIRHPAATASAVASLVEMAPGRIALGLGAGDRATLEKLNIEMVKPLSAVREAVGMIRSLLTRRVASVEGEVFKVKEANLNFRCKSSVPIYIGAQGPLMLRLAGEIGEGVLVNASHPEDIGYAVKQIKRGAEKAGRSIEDLDVAVYTAFSVDEDGKKALKAATPVVAFIVAGSPNQILERHGIDLEAASKIRSLIVKGRIPEAIQSVTADMLDVFSIAGEPKDVARRIEECLEVGVTQLVVGSPIGPKPYSAMKIVSSKIMPIFR